MVYISAGTLLVGRLSLARAVLVLWCPSDHHHNQIHCTWVPWMIQCRVGAELGRFWKSGRIKSLMGGIEMLKCKSLSLSLSTSSLGQVVWPKTDRGIRNQLPRLLTHRLFTAKPNYAIWIGLRVHSQPNPRLSRSLSRCSARSRKNVRWYHIISLFQIFVFTLSLIADVASNALLQLINTNRIYKMMY